MTVVVFSCPEHGVLVEYDAPGPAHPPTSCWRVLTKPNVIMCPPPVCRKLLVRSEREA